MKMRLGYAMLVVAVIALISASSATADETFQAPFNVTTEVDAHNVTVTASVGRLTVEVGDEPLENDDSRRSSSSQDQDSSSEQGQDDRDRLDERLVNDVDQVVTQTEEDLERLVNGLGPLLPTQEDATPEEDPADDDAPTTPHATPAAVAEPDAPAGLLVAGALVATVGLAAATKNGLFGRFGATMAAALFSRFEGPAVLKHPRRAELHRLVCRTPGTTVPDLCLATGLTRNTVLHHLRMLADQDMIVEKRMGRSAHWFENGGRYGREHQAAYAVLRDGRSRDVARFVLDHPGTTQRQVSHALGLAPSVIHWHLRRLEEAALVQRRKNGRTMQCFPSDPLSGLGI